MAACSPIRSGQLRRISVSRTEGYSNGRFSIGGIAVPNLGSSALSKATYDATELSLQHAMQHQHTTYTVHHSAAVSAGCLHHSVLSL